ncbi:mucin-5AC isoform X2 [Oncorhynchus mykiss]|uniref:mucin-5AC isoform X2 n=1 Tax=Oncorhynchus mykiss TaxID=8022 RepID=UPI0018775E0C|nr:mucin-5AC isoform X2 [Oncorhynchus mykiss]
MTLFCHQLFILLWIVVTGGEPNTQTPGTHGSPGPTDTSMTPGDRSTTLLSTTTPVSTEPSSATTDRATTTQDPSTVHPSTDGTLPTTAAVSKTKEVSTTTDLTSTSDTTESTGVVGTTATETRTIPSVSTAEITSSHKTSAYTVTSLESTEKDSQSTDSGMTTPTTTPALSRGVSPSTTEHAGASSSVTTETGRTSNTTPDIVPTSSTKEPGTHETTAINTATTNTGTKDSETTGTGITKSTIPPTGQTSLSSTRPSSTTKGLETSLSVTEGGTLSSTRPSSTTKGPETSLPVTEGGTLSSTRPSSTTKGPETSLPVSHSTSPSTSTTANTEASQVPTTKGPETSIPVTDGATSSTPTATITGSPHTDKTTGTQGTTDSTTTADTPALPPTSGSSSSPPSPGSTQTPGSSTEAPIDTSTTTPATSPTITPTGETSEQPTSKTSESPLPPFHTSTSPTGGITTQPESAITATTSLPPPISIVCPSTPCPYDSICLNGTCQCVSGTFLLEGRCVQAQVFSGDLHLNQTFQDEMSNRSSVIFQQTAARISEALRRALENESGYSQTDVVLLRQGSVIATVNNVFKLGSSATQTSTNGAIEKAIQACGTTCGTILQRATFTATDLCDQAPQPCDVRSTTCEYKEDGVTRCSCKAGYINSFYSNQSCTACPSGQRSEGDACVPCPFGYAGFNCTDSALLAVVVIACVLGGVLLIMLLALFAYCCWYRSQSVKKPSAEFSSPYPVEDFQGPWSTTQGITPIPRASTNWASAPMEMTEGGSTHHLVDMKPHTNGAGFHILPKRGKKTGSYDLTSDSMNTFKGKNQSRYSYLVQGHENPYFIPADDRRPV